MKEKVLQTMPRSAFTLEILEQPTPAPQVRRKRWPKSPRLRLPKTADPEMLLNRALQELVRYYRHSSVGRLARGLIHQMNSSLQVLFLQLELLEQKSEEELQILGAVSGQPGKELQALHRYRLQKTRQLRQELEKIQTLAQTVVRHGGHEEAEDQESLDLNELYRRELELYQARPFFRHGVEKRWYLREGLPPVCGHYIDFSQSFRLLLDNALEAMEGGERCCLTVGTAYEEGRIFLHLGDTGGGIPPAIRPHIFEPFFTTKGNGGKGHAGLGLFLARRLLAPYGGEIKVHSIPGETWVTVSIPLK